MRRSVLVAFYAAWTGHVGLWLAALRLGRQRKRRERALRNQKIREAEQMGRYR